ncbi:MAG: O-succinylhomoserine sulfhydrylase [Alphaproteobacteria bacterium]|nr:O-succinylhomoserine sulfhydrylase [Alphaproteobacteria bacterium]MDA8675240.1 O-succinylhomoserine sulfhydrylase [Alphaproteobacteria bacterium]MDG2466173.1 O-succinylhomoserine sulfhydrylase [Alphaproteobacteria bacterium]
MSKNKSYHPDTLAVRGGLNRSQFDETAEALYLTSGYVYSSAQEAADSFSGDLDRFVYSRYGNPTVTMLQERMALLEGAESCRMTASGMAAVFATMASLLKSGDRVVASRALFGACHAILTQILPQWGIETELVDGTDMTAWEDALSRPAQMVFVETPSNPLLELVDLELVTALAHQAGALMVVDNVFATPLGQKPIEYGVDLVVYSATKHIDGHGRVLGGAILGKSELVDEQIFKFLCRTGPSISPFNAWVLLKSLESLSLRVDRMVANADHVARYITQHCPDIIIRYPWLESHPQYDLARKQMRHGGNIIAMELPGGQAACFRFLDSLNIIDISNNLGDAKSLICHPFTTTHSNLDEKDRALLGIKDGHIRLSVGLEHADDLIDDIMTGYAAINS